MTKHIVWNIRAHGGTAHPFFRPAYDKVLKDVPALMKKYGAKGPEEICKRLIAYADRNIYRPTPNAKGKVCQIDDTGALGQSGDYLRIA
jgi:hypothetical protein